VLCSFLLSVEQIDGVAARKGKRAQKAVKKVVKKAGKKAGKKALKKAGMLLYNFA
jgi:hypothetical protein